MMKISLLNLEKISSYNLSKVFLSENEKIVLSKISDINRKKQYLGCRYLLQRSIEKLGDIYLGTEKNKKNKPFLKDSNYSISFSHSKKIVACSFSNFKSIGIDIEHFDEKIFSVKDKFLNISEKEKIKNDMKSLILIFSAKESIYKTLCYWQDLNFFDFRKINFLSFSKEKIKFSFEQYFFEVGFKLYKNFCLTYTFLK
jgi:4'-phosphopantetheinyl transferase EntD